MSVEENIDKKNLNILLTFDQRQLICQICLKNWTNNNPRCLPCNIFHAFCSDCLQNFADANQLKPGSPFLCLLCQASHIWPQNGVETFLRLKSIFKNPKMNLNQEAKPMEISDNNLDENSCLSDAERKDMQECILGAMKAIQSEKKIEKNRIFKEYKKFLKVIEESKKSLESQIDHFFAKKEEELKNLNNDIISFKSFDFQTSKLFEINVREMKTKLLDEMDKIVTSKIQFEYTNDHNEFKLGYNVMLYDELAGFTKICRNGEQAVSLSSNDDYVFVLTKYVSGNEECTYSLLKENIQHKAVQRLVVWRVNSKEIKTFYLSTNNNEIFLLSVGQSRHIISLKSSPIGYTLEDLSTTESWTDLVCYEAGVFLFRHGLIAKYDNNMVEIWNKQAPYDLQVAEMKYINQTLFLVDKNNSNLFSVNSLNGSYTIIPMTLMSLSFDLNSHMIKLVTEKYLFIDSQGVYEIHMDEKKVNVYSIAQAFEKPDIIHLCKNSNGRNLSFYFQNAHRPLTIKHLLFKS